MSRALPPPGWYPDNQNPFLLRYWDGHAWTGHTRMAGRTTTPAKGPGFGRGLLVGLLAGAGAIGAVILLVAAALAIGTQAGGSQGEAGEVTSVQPRHQKPAAQNAQKKAQKAQKKAEKKQQEPGSKHGAGDRKSHHPQAAPRPEPRSVPKQRTYLVTRVVDGDTLELGNGETVRLVGIDTPEVGQCGYDRATAALARLVSGHQVELGRSDEDRDRYGRLLRYVDVGDVDAGLRLIKNGLAIARYDSRDGYGFHPRQPRYVAADTATANLHCPRPAPAPQPLVGGGGGACAPGYSPCVPPYPPDVDCADTGPVTVTGADPHGLDADNDGFACGGD
jgi:endonuclease YncB( thermonuclease family)